jgi:acyl-CoA thioesterase FadM
VTATIDSPQLTTLLCRPRFEGANIRTWIGFKHFMYLVEEAILQWFRDQGCGPQRLYHEHGLGLEILDSSVQLPALLEIDDEVLAKVVARGHGRFVVTLHIGSRSGRTLGLRGKVTVGLIREHGGPAGVGPAGELAELICEDARAPEVAPEAPMIGGAPFQWSWRARYFHCHFSDRVQHSAYVRALEEVVERFLAERGISIRTMLQSRGWIPVVSRARVQLVAAAHMEETIHTTFVVHEILKESAFDATMDCHVERDGSLVRVATARILHGYAASRGDDAGGLVVLDPEVQARLMGRLDR